MTNVSNGYGKILKAKRTAMGLTQNEFGKLCGLSGGCISNCENDVEIKDSSLKAIKTAIREYEDRLTGTGLANYKMAVQYSLFVDSKTIGERRLRLHKLMLAANMALLDMDRNE